MRTLAFVAAALAAVSAEPLVTVHEPSFIPEGWTATSDVVPANVAFDVTIGVKRSNVKVLDRLIDEVSNPRHGSYLQYPKYEEMGNLVRPSAEHTAVVKKWLAEGGVKVTKTHPHGDYMHGEATVGQLEKMARGKFMKYVHKETGSVVYRMTTGVKVPASVAAAIDTFSGFHGFPLPPRKAEVGLAGHVNPAVFRSTYNMTTVLKSGVTNIQAIAQFQGQYVNDEDLATFCKEFDDQSVCKISKYIGKNKQNAGIESMLDTEYIMSIGALTTTWVYSYPSFDFCSDLTTFGSDVTSESPHPWVISISYGSQKIGMCSASIVQRFSQDIQKMGTMGISVMISSGDDGSGGNTRQGSNGGKLSPSFPASIPYCTAVGSTYFVSDNKGVEQATTQFGSGGGFSYDFPIPAYQSAGIRDYLANVTLPHAEYAKNGRGSPDVATLGESFTVLANGRTMAVGGTSASSPSFAGMISTLNEECLKLSGKTLGFLNPLFYQNPKIFTDITRGTNAIGDNSAAGWAAIRGWDACTGLGVPNFPSISAIVKEHCK